MLCKLLILILASKTTLAQMDGEFWWLSDKVTKLKGVEAPPPKFEELGEFDTDESAKIIFRDEDLIAPDNKFEETNVIDSEMNKKIENSFEGSGYIVWPDDTFRKPTLSKNDDIKQLPGVINKETETKIVPSDAKLKSEDLITFKYEDDNNVISIPPATTLKNQSARQNISIAIVAKPVSKKEKINKTTEEHTKINNTDSFTFKFPDDNLLSKPTFESPKKNILPLDDDQKNVMIDNSNEIINSMHDKTALSKTTPKENYFSENICTYMEKNMCYQRNGLIYKSKKESVKNINIDELVCCILIIQAVDPYGIIFPDSTEIQPHRFRRSNKEESATSSTNQRDFLLRQRYRPKNVRPTSLTKVVTPEDNDYVDPYLNIKGSNLRKQNTHSSSKQDCNYPDYVEDYVVELPRPGLVGLYSDNGQRPSWSFSNENSRPSYGATDDFSEEDEEPSFGYSTVDPRRGSSTNIPKRGRPMKFTTNSPPEVAYDVESHTVSFQSTPNFQVLQGFKLLNLGRNRNKFYSKNTKRGTAEGSVENSKESEKITAHLNSNLGEQVYENCGNSRKLVDNDRNDKQVGEAENGSHPWMALVVLTRQPQGILCYATIVHPRAAVTAADCVYGRSSPKEVSLITGLWNLGDRSRTQNRVATVQMHPQYRPKVLGHALALLHWKTPLKLNANIQPACLGNLHGTDDCKFFGWGGFDQGFRLRSRWQRASVLSAQECEARLAKAVPMPDNAFCATVQTRGTVTGLGGSLICDVNGRKVTSGIAVWRDNALVLVPAHEWILRAFQDLDIE